MLDICVCPNRRCSAAGCRIVTFLMLGGSGRGGVITLALCLPRCRLPLPHLHTHILHLRHRILSRSFHLVQLLLLSHSARAM
jgi:hypothetical protein